MKTGYYLAGCILLFNSLLVGLFGILRLIGVFDYQATHESNLYLFVALLTQLLCIIFGWTLILGSDPKNSQWAFEKALAEKFGKITNLNK